MARLNGQSGFSLFWRRVLLCVLMCVGGGAIYAATEYKWQDGQTSTVGGNAVYEWSNYKNWQYLGMGWQNISDSSADYPGQNANGHDNTTAIVYLNTADNGGNNIVVYITNDITLGSLYIESDEGKSVTLVLSDGVQVTVGHLILGNKGGNAKEVHFTVSGNGTISVTEDIRYKNTSSASTVTLKNQAKIKAKNIFNEQGGEVSFSGDGTGTLALTQATSTPAGVSINSSVNYEDQNTVKVYYWVGASGGAWNVSTNWRKDNASGAPVGHYPGFANGDTAIIPAGNTVRNLTLADGSYSLTISNPTYVTGSQPNQRVSIEGTAEDYSASFITIKGYVLFNSCSVGGLQVSSGKLQISTAGANAFALKATSLTVSSDSEFLGYASDTVTVSGDLSVEGSFTMAQRTSGTGVKNGTLTIRGSTSVESGRSLTLPAKNDKGLLTSVFEGSVTNNGTFKSDGMVTFKGSVINNGTFTGDGSVSFNSTVSNNGTFSCGSGRIICKGDYESGAGASFTASSGDTVFYGNADFSAGTFTHGGGTVHFFTTNTDYSQKTMTTCTNQAFNRLRFGGNVRVVATGAVTANELLMERYDSVTEYLSATAYPGGFTARITGGSLTVASKTVLTRVSDQNGVIGCLRLDCDFVFNNVLNMSSGTALVVGQGKTAAIAGLSTNNVSNEYSYAIDVEGTLNVTGNMKCYYTNLLVEAQGSLSVSGDIAFENNPATVTKGNAAKTVLGKSDEEIKNCLYTAAGGSVSASSITMANVATDTKIQNGGTITAPSITGVPSLINYGTITAATEISANSVFSNSVIKTASLTADDFKAGTSDSRAGTLEITGNGGTLRINNPAEPYSWLNNLTIDDGATLTLYASPAGEKAFSVYGDWTNRNATGGLVVNDYALSFKGVEKTVSGSQVFYDVDFGESTSITGSNTFNAFKAVTLGKTLTFGAGTSQTISSSFTLAGASGNRITLKSASPGTAWNISAPTTTEATSTVQYVDVSDSHATNIITAKSTATAPENDNVDGGNNVNWVFADYTYTWTGDASESPQVAANWSPKSLPSPESHILIPDGRPRYPSFSGAITYSVRSLTVGTANESSHTAKITLGGGLGFSTASLTNYGSVDLRGSASFTASGTYTSSGTVLLTGSETITLPAAGASVTEGGVWHYAGDGSGSVREIANLSYNKLILSGTLGVAGGYSIAAAEGIQLGTETEELTIQGDARFKSPVTLANKATIVGAAGHVIAFDETIDGNKALTLQGGYVSFHKDVGKINPLASLSCTINGTDYNGDPEYALTLCGVSVTTTGDQSYTGYLALYGSDSAEKDSAGDSSLESTGGSITFSYKIFSDGRNEAFTHGLSIGAAGTVTFEESVGDRTQNPLTFLTVDAPAIIVKSVVKTDGVQTYTGAVTNSGTIMGNASPLTFNGSVTNETTGTITGGGGIVTFASTVQNKGTITLSNGSATFTGAYSGSNGSLTASKETTTFASDVDFLTTTFDANGGTVIFSGDNASVSGNSTTGTAFASAIFKGSGMTLGGDNSFSSALCNADTIFSGNNTFGTFLAETGGTMLTLGAGSSQTVTGLTPAALKLTGTESERISLAGSGTFVVAKTGFSGEYLSVGNDVKIAEVAGSVVPGAFSTTNSTIASGAVLSNVLNNGWKFTALAFEWEGDVDGSWDNAANWNVGFVPGTENFTDSTVTISAGKTNYPQVTATSYTLQSLTIGSDLAPEASLAFSGTGNINVSGTFTNHGRVHYQNSGRIRDGSSAPLNDTANNGWVEYDGSASLTDFAPASDADYANLRVSAAVSLGGDIVVSGRFENTASGTVDGNSGLYVGGDALVEGALGSLVQLSAFSVSGLATVGADISTSGSQLYGDDLTLSSGAAFTSSASSLTFSGPVNSSSSPKDNLTLQAVDVTFSDTVSVGQVTTHAAVTVAEGAFVHASDQQRYDGKVTNKGRISGENLITFEGEVLNTGTIAVPALADGVVALIFAGQYEGSAGTLTGAQTTDEDKSPNPVIECRGNVSLGTFTHNDDSLLFSGTSPQTLVTNGQAVKDISFANAAGVSISDDVTVTGNWSNTGICMAATTATFTGEGKTVSGNNSFATAVFTGGLMTITGDNSFAMATFSGAGTTLSGNNTFVTAVFTGGHMMITGDNSFTMATFSGADTTVSGSNTFATAVFNADTSLSGNNTFAVFSVSRKDTVLSFGAGTNQTVTDLFFVQGEEDHLVTLKSTLAGSVWHINVPVDKADVSYALVSDSVSAFEEIQARLSVNGGNNTFWDFMEGLPLPSLRMMLSPVGDNRIYALFSGKIYYKGVSLGNLSGPEYDEAVPLVIQNIYFITAGGNPATESSCIQTDWQINRMDFVAEDDGYTLLYLHLSKNISLEDLSGMSVYIKLLQAPSVKHFHALSDFALNVVQPVYARTEEVASSTVRDFTADSQDRLRAESDITLQVQLIGGRDGQGKSQPVKNGEKALLIPDLKADIKSTWKSNVVNSLLGTDWRVWLTAALESLATSYNDAPQKSAEGKPVEDSGGLLYNFTLINAADKASQTDYYGWKAKDEVQFIFKIQDSSGNDILVDIDGDGSRKIPLYALSMPKVSAKAMPLLDLWSFRFKDVQKQRGGVTIMNNVIDVNQREQTVIQVDMAEAGFLNVYVMTLDGNIVQQLEHGHISAGSHYYRWDGSNTGGSSVARGLYFVRVVGSGIDETRKVLCVKD